MGINSIRHGQETRSRESVQLSRLQNVSAHRANYLVKLLYKGKLVQSFIAYNCLDHNEARKQLASRINKLTWDEICITETL